MGCKTSQVTEKQTRNTRKRPCSQDGAPGVRHQPAPPTAPSRKKGTRTPLLHLHTLFSSVGGSCSVFFSCFVRWFVLNVFSCWPAECCCLVLYFPVRKGKALCCWCLANASLVPEDPVTFTAVSATWARGNDVPSISTAAATTAAHQELQAAFTACMSTSRSGHPSNSTYSNTQSCSPCAI